MEKAVNQISAYVESLLADDHEIFLVGLVQKGKGAGAKLIILLDGDKGVSIEKCAEMSRQVSHFIDEMVELNEPLTLEVSSAGLDHPLLLNRQYVKNIGKNVKTTLNDHTIIEGKLLGVTDESIQLDVIIDKKKKTVAKELINFEDINKTIVLVSFK